MPGLFRSLAGDPSEVTALGTRHWITSFRCVDGNISIGTESAPVKGPDGKHAGGTKTRIEVGVPRIAVEATFPA